MNTTFYDLYHTVIKNKDEKGSVDNKYENDFFITPNRYIGIKPRKTILK